ncbi:hypothetical protein [Bosea lathyri]|uniref:Terminase small subunit n=1 Tax=Bosea lathyri TaxID=1036778 RepID=A0A1H6BWC1_9HYPH|nr:hypothetical protein [Bosea lathyri]SEG64737.1 hypothetical protein SAMN04488115_108121 [Bosea lathyri]
MPLKNGRFTLKEKKMVAAMAVTDNPEASAAIAGYKDPVISGWRFMQNPIFQEATREAGQALLREKAGAIGVATLVSIALDERQPAGARVTAGTNLVKLSGMAVTEGQGEKDLHEMTGDELAKHRAKLERQAEAITAAMADRARPVLENEASEPRNAPDAPDIFG